MKSIKRPILESIAPKFGNSFTIRNFDTSSNQFAPKWHFHPEIELVYVDSGSGKRHIGNHVSHYTQGDLVLIGSNLPHFGFTDRLTGNKSEVVIQALPDFLGEDFFKTPEMHSIEQLFKRSKQGIIFHSAVKQSVGPKMEDLCKQSPFQRLLGFLEILKELSETDQYTQMHVDHITLESKPQDAQRLDIVYSLVRSEFKRSIPLKEVADALSMSEPSFSRYFKGKTGKTFTQFLNEYRLVHASKLMAEKDISITNICYESGFNNFSHFSKKFKQFTGKTPSQYRNEFRTVLEN